MNNHISTMLDIHPSWKRIILSKTLKPLLIEALNSIEMDLLSKGVSPDNIKNNINDYICPNVENIFECFKYFDANNLRCIIIGQDPYPNQEDAMGLSFSIRPSEIKQKIPASLKNIFKSLLHQKLIEGMPTSGDLRGWACQGVLLLNSMLTRTMEINNGIIINNGSKSNINKHKFWLKFTNAFLNFMSDIYADKIAYNHWDIHVMLWGQEAQKLSCSYNLLRWGHPSPLNTHNKIEDPESFLYCDHFTQVDIDWNNREINDELMSAYALTNFNEDDISNLQYPYDDGTNHPLNLLACNKFKFHLKICVVFTDGSCADNGGIDPRTTFGVWFPKKYHGNFNGLSGKIYGELSGKKLIYKDKLIHTNEIIIKNNPRAELIATVYAIIKIHDTWNYNKVIMVIDNDYALKTLDQWIYRWNDFSSKKNTDLLEIIWELLCNIAEKIDPQVLNKFNDESNNDELDVGDIISDIIHSVFTFVWQKSHLAKKNYHKWDYENICGNAQADKLCKLGIGHKEVIYKFN